MLELLYNALCKMPIKYKKRFRSLCSTFLEIQNSADEYTGWYNFGEYLKAGD